MDGSRRYSKIYCKTQAGADAMASARGILSSSARQLLILLDGERDFDELSAIFGEEVLYRLLPQLESQGYIEPLLERGEIQTKVETKDTVKPTVPVTASPLTVQKSTPTSLPVAPPANAPIEAAPVAAPTKMSRRFLAVPIAILASLVTAQAMVNWIFEREQHEPETSVGQNSVPAVTAAPSASPSLTPLGSSGASASATTPSQPPATQSPSPQPVAERQRSAPLQSVVATAAPVAPTDQTGSETVSRAKAPPAPSANASKPPPVDPTAQSMPDNSRAAPRGKAASQPSAASFKPAAPQASAQPEEAKSALSSPVHTPAEANSAPSNAGASATGESLRTNALASATSTSTPSVAPAVSILHVRSRVLPSISKRALQNSIYSGHATVRLHVNSSGRVERVELVNASPPEVYGPDVQQALEQWTFEPPSNPAQFTLELDFREKAPEAAAVPSKSAEAPQE